MKRAVRDAHLVCTGEKDVGSRGVSSHTSTHTARFGIGCFRSFSTLFFCNSTKILLGFQVALDTL